MPQSSAFRIICDTSFNGPEIDCSLEALACVFARQKVDRGTVQCTVDQLYAARATDAPVVYVLCRE